MTLPIAFELERYTHIPAIFPADDHRRPGVKSLFFQNEEYLARETRVFGWMGMPYLREGDTCPAMVLVHGGRGTAFDEWVRLWNGRGYAAIAVDLCGCAPRIPTPQTGIKYDRHDFAGPEGWDASFQQMHQKTEDQWQFHAITALLRAHTIIANAEGVDPDRIGITGISWGGYLTCLMMGIDPRYKAAIPVYGCSCMTDSIRRSISGHPRRRQEEIEEWGKRWDAIHYIPNASMPSLWITGTNDGAYPFDYFAKSCSCAADPTVSMRVEMQHGHANGWAPHEIHHFTDAIFRGGAPLPRHVETRANAGRIVARFASVRPLMGADFCYTRASGMWTDRKWNQVAVSVEEEGAPYEVSAELPADTTAAFINVWDDRDLLVSSTHIEP